MLKQCRARRRIHCLRRCQAAPAQCAPARCDAGRISTRSARGPASRENNLTIPEGPSKGDRMASCMWPLAARIWHDQRGASAASAQREAALAELDNAANDMKSQGWIEERQDIGGARCSP